jgi:hypothetical protein
MRMRRATGGNPRISGFWLGTVYQMMVVRLQQFIVMTPSASFRLSPG